LPATRVLLPTGVPSSLPGEAIRPPPELKSKLSAVFVVGEPDSPREVEWVYECESLRYLRILVWPRGAPDSLRYPPTLGRQPCWHEKLQVDRVEVYHAYFDERYGPHDCVWECGDLITMLLVKPVSWTGRAWLYDLLVAMLL
jgi:hypothetical protein